MKQISITESLNALDNISNNKYDLLLRGLFIDEAINTNANQASQNSLLNNHTVLESIKFKEHPKIPRQTIYSWIKKWNIPNIEYPTFGQFFFIIISPLLY